MLSLAQIEVIYKLCALAGFSTFPRDSDKSPPITQQNYTISHYIGNCFLSTKIKLMAESFFLTEVIMVERLRIY